MHHHLQKPIDPLLQLAYSFNQSRRMAADGSPGNPTNETAEDDGPVLRQYLSGPSANGDDDLAWDRRDGDDDANDQDADDQDFEVGEDEEQVVIKDDPGIEIDGEPNNAQSDMVMDDAGPDDQDLLDDDVHNGDIGAENGDEAELDESEGPEDLAHVKEEPSPPVDPNIWTLPADKDICTLDEIRRGQVINRVAPNECPVLGCGKKINEMRAEPSPGTIASGLRTHVLFVHYAMTCKRAPRTREKRKLPWSGKRRNSPMKPFPMSQNNDIDYNMDPENFAMPSNDIHQSSPLSASLLHRSASSQNRSSPLGSILNRKARQFSSNNIHPQQQHQQNQSSLQSLMQATGMGGFETNNGSKYSPHPKQRGQDPSSSQKSLNQTTSSLFSILAGLTHAQQGQSIPRSQHHQPPNQRANLSLTSAIQTNSTRNTKPAHEANTLSLSQCSKNGDGNSFMHNQSINSSLLSLLNEKISGTVASSLQSQLQKARDPNNETSSTTNSRLNPHSNNNHYYQSNVSNNDNHDIYKNNSNNHSSLNNINMSNGSNSQTSGQNNSFSLNQFIESIAKRTGSNIGPGGVAETKKIIEKFVTWLMQSSQTIADHYIAPFSSEAPQQKPEISASDVILAYKMMQKSQLQ